MNLRKLELHNFNQAALNYRLTVEEVIINDIECVKINPLDGYSNVPVIIRKVDIELFSTILKSFATNTTQAKTS